MRLFFITCLAVAASAQDPVEIIRKSIEKNFRNQEVLKDYSYIERNEVREVDRKGVLGRARVTTHEVFTVKGRQYRKLIAKDDKPLSAVEAHQEQERMKLADARREALLAENRGF